MFKSNALSNIGSLIPILLLLFSIQITTYAQNAPTIQICGEEQVFCIDQALFEVCVNIDVDANSSPIDFFEIQWDDGSDNTIIDFSNNLPDINHEYDLTSFFNDCDECTNDFAIFLFTHYEDGSVVNNGFVPTFKNAPRPAFSPNPPVPCVGTEITFNDSSCPDNVTVVSWDFGDGSPLTTDNMHTYDIAGTYMVELVVENSCGIESITQEIEVILPATAIANVSSGTEPNQNNPYVVCLDGGTATVILEAGTGSENENSYLWEVIDGDEDNFEWQIIDMPNVDEPVTDTATIIFSGEDLITIVLETNNECGQPAFDTLSFEIVGGGVALNPQNDECVELIYTPDPFDPDNSDVVYTINGTVIPIADFPVTLPADIDPYVVEVMGNSLICENPTASISFFVFAESMANIIYPNNDTICSLDGIVNFQATPDGGTWRIDGDDIGTGSMLSFNPANYPSDTYTITYGNECIVQAETMLTIITADITMPPSQEVCLDEPPLTFTATPNNGTWSGPGITPNGIFDPMLTGVGDFTLYYEVDNPSLQSCSNLDSFVVTVTQLMVDFQTTECTGTELCFATINTSMYDNICWFFDGMGPFTQDEPCFDFQTAGTHEVMVTIKKGECTATQTTTITIEDAPTAAFTLTYDADNCSDLPITFTNNSLGNNLTYQWFLNGQLFSNLATPDTILTAYAQDTIHTITLTVGNACAQDSHTKTVLVKPRPVLIFGIAQNEYCSGDTLEIVNNSFGNITNWQWLLNGELISTDSIEPVISILTEVTDTVEVCLIATNECGTDTLCQEVVVVPTDVNAFFNTSPTAVCVGDTVWFTNFSTLGIPVFYQFGDGNSTSEPNPFHIYTVAGTYTVVLQAFGCGFDSFENEIIVLESPVASWNNPGPTCPNEPLFFENTTFNAMDFQWDFGDGTTATVENPTHTFDTSGIFEVCLTITDINIPECSHTTCDFVEIFAIPMADFTTTDSICLGDETQFTNTSINAMQCFYDFGDGNTSVNCDVVHIYQNAGLYNVTLIVENANFCPDTILKQVFVRELPVPNFTFDLMNGCHPDTIQFTNLSTNANSYLWDFGDGEMSVLTNPNHVFQNPETYQIKLLAMIDGICEAETVQTITIDETPTAIFTANAPSACANSEVVFTNISTGTFTNVQWNFGDGSFSFDNNPTHIFTYPGVYLIELLVENGTACSHTTTLEYTIHEPLTAELATTNILCNGDETGSINLSDLTGTMPYQFAWSNGLTTQNPDDLPAGTYSVVVTDMNACTWAATAELTEPETLAVETNISPVSCFGGNDGSVSIDISGGIAPYDILWETGKTTAIISDLTADDYSLTITDANACVLELTITLPENQPIEYADSVQHISCFDAHDGVIEFDSIFGAVAPYSVLVMNQNYEAGGVNVTRFDSLGRGIYTIEIEDANGCFIQFETEILEPAPISVDATIDNFNQDSVEIILGESIEISTFFNPDNPIFNWLSATDLSCNNCPDPVGTPNDDRVYIVEMTDENGCIATDTLAVSVLFYNDIWLPEAFTPDNLTKNNVFRIRSDYQISVAQIEFFQIFDRWGNMVWESNGFLPNEFDGGWDGRVNGIEALPGKYTYRAKVTFKNQKNTMLEGQVMLMR